jgi:hypothetical protein
MHFDKFSFGTLRIDGAEKSANARRQLPGNSVTSLGICPCPARKRYPGNATSL